LGEIGGRVRASVAMVLRVMYCTAAERWIEDKTVKRRVLHELVRYLEPHQFARKYW